jgi:hypothetical protein
MIFNKQNENSVKVRAYKLEPYDIFSTTAFCSEPDILINNVVLKQNRVYYKVEVGGKLTVSIDDGDFRLVKIEDGYATFLNRDAIRNVEEEDMVIEEFLSNKLIKTR